MNTSQAAEYLGVCGPTLILWRQERRGPRYAKLGKRVVYRLQDLEGWMDKNMVEPEENEG